MIMEHIDSSKKYDAYEQVKTEPRNFKLLKWKNAIIKIIMHDSYLCIIKVKKVQPIENSKTKKIRKVGTFLKYKLWVYD